MPFIYTGGGVKWGKHGKLYKGKDAKKKAEKQMKAIKASQARRKKKNG